MTEATAASRNLARNVRALRRRKNMSQQQLADLAEMPRSTVTHIESGSGNPALANLAKMSDALGVGIEELLSAPRTEVSLRKRVEISVRSRDSGKIRIHKLLPERIKGLEIDRMDLLAESSFSGTPHIKGTKEYLYCLEGRITVLVAGQVLSLEPGDVLAFPGDQAHSYRNRTTGPASAISVVLPVPVSV